MTRTISIKVFLTLICALPLFAGQREQIEDAKAQTVLVTNEGFLGSGRGSGVLLDSTHVLTCAHMANTPKDEFFIYTYPLGHVIKAHVEMADTNDDILLLVLESSVPVRVTPVFQGATYDGEAITIIGNGLGSMKWIVSHGVVSGTEQDYLLTDAHINPGNSGGPWFNDKGEIVALSDWGIGPAPHMIGIAGGVSAKRINEVLLSYKRMQDFAARLQKLFGGAI